MKNKLTKALSIVAVSTSLSAPAAQADAEFALGLIGVIIGSSILSDQEQKKSQAQIRQDREAFERRQNQRRYTEARAEENRRLKELQREDRKRLEKLEREQRERQAQIDKERRELNAELKRNLARQAEERRLKEWNDNKPIRDAAFKAQAERQAAMQAEVELKSKFLANLCSEKVREEYPGFNKGFSYYEAVDKWNMNVVHITTLIDKPTRWDANKTEQYKVTCGYDTLRDKLISTTTPTRQ